ncbi:MAG: N-formylglutamate deformylase [Sorangiineae bacterium]|nr:N-formylglutamate deformylase [Polyangiaceae bacterium]MEB2321024.1 N-formylglutamate deformylase [Sorangiineae bacterium]
MDGAFVFSEGTIPLLVSFPHDGTAIPAALARRMTPAALARPDTDWHVARLYEFVTGLGASTLRPELSRYVVDLNRDPTGLALYPGADNTGIVPLDTFAREPIYLPGAAPDEAECVERVARHFAPYHAKLAGELERLLGAFGVAVLLDAHSIPSVVPRFFEGTLPDLNLGSARGASAAPELAARAFCVLEAAEGYRAVRDGRFTGGYITRHYGAPERGVHALQLELAQKNYMVEAPPFSWVDERASALRLVLRAFVEELAAFARERSR